MKLKECSDRFTSLMSCTNNLYNDETLFAVYIDGLDAKFQELMNVSRAAALTMWSRLSYDTPLVSIAAEIANSNTLDAARCTSKQGSTKSFDKGHKGCCAKRYASCMSKWHTTEQHKPKKKKDYGASVPSTKGTASSAPSPNEVKEKKYFRFKKL